MAVEESMEAGRAALRNGRWQEAVDAFEASLQERETPEALDGVAEALWWLCDASASVRWRERAYVAFKRLGDHESACRAAVNLSIAYLVNLGNEAAAHGWLARAERVMSDAERNTMQGWLWLIRGFLSPDPDGRPYLANALDWARDTKDIDLELIALADLGLALVIGGQAGEGIALLDEAMAGTLAGEFERLETVVYTSCNMLAACHRIGDLERASQWCRVADEFMREYSCPFLFARCRVHYGSVLLAKGRWKRAEEELVSAIRLAVDAGPGPRVEAVARLAELRSRQGRIEEAEELLRDLDDPLITLPAAEIHLIRGEPTIAVELLERRLEQLDDFAELVPTLAMLVDALIACGDLDSAREVERRLVAIAEPRGSHAAALSALASAHLAAADGLPDRIARLESAMNDFTRLDLPLEAARIRLSIARALAQAKPRLAIVEAGAALTTLERLGAKVDVDAAASLLRSLGAPRGTGPRSKNVLTKREQEVLHLVGRGLSNPEIAQRLFISRKTAAHHVSNLLAKLGLRNRAEAVAYAARSEPRTETSVMET